MAFHLPGAELRPVTGFHHNISTGDSPPVEVEDEPPENPVKALSPVKSELRQVAYEFGKHLNSLPTKTATASQAYKFVYGAYLQALSSFVHIFPCKVLHMEVKSVQSALSDLKRPPERLQSQCNYRPFIT